MEIYTIGHSNHKWEFFLSLLKQNKIEMLIDVRAVPRSRFAPWANKALGEFLAKEGIKYRWLGDKLGGNPALMKERGKKISKADFAGWDRRESYQQAIAALLEEAARQRTAIMCAEEDPNHCHRELLIGETLKEKGVEVKHIRGRKTNLQPSLF